VSQTFSVVFPFVRATREIRDEEGTATVPTWRPGTAYEAIDNQGNGASFADGCGWMHLVEISRHKPGKYPERVFYTREFEDPDGKRFGKRGLRMTTAPAFARLCAGYRVPYTVHDLAKSGGAQHG
jgi:hypothetical protein